VKFQKLIYKNLGKNLKACQHTSKSIFFNKFSRFNLVNNANSENQTQLKFSDYQKKMLNINEMVKNLSNFCQEV
jgi:hypothetical protein